MHIDLEYLVWGTAHSVYTWFLNGSVLYEHYHRKLACKQDG